MAEKKLCKTYLGVYDNILDGYSLPLDYASDIKLYFNREYGVVRLHVLDNSRIPHMIVVLNHQYIIYEDDIDKLYPEIEKVFDFCSDYYGFREYYFIRCPYNKVRDTLLNLECAIVGNRAHVLADLDSVVINSCLH